MAGRLLALSARNIKVRPAPFGAAGAHSEVHHDPITAAAGNREFVGFGLNGQPNYVDRSDFPLPALRWKEATPDSKALHEKEKGDWRQLSLEEKKCLYRSSFRQTFAEFKAPTGEWKSIIGMTFVFCSLGIWLFIGLKTFVYNPLPDSFSEDNQRAQLRRMLDMHTNPIEGISSKWDYENNRWKK